MSDSVKTPEAATHWGPSAFTPRRTHTWVPAEQLGQPQDGGEVSDNMEWKDGGAATHHARELHEPEDARLTGGTRSLMRRVLGLNVTLPASTPLRAVTDRIRTRFLQRLPLT